MNLITTLNTETALTTTAAPFVPSVHQANFFSWIVDPASVPVNGQVSGSCILKAVAGSGKSTSIERCLPLIPSHKSVQVFVFSADIAKDWKVRIAKLVEREGHDFRNVNTGTFHGKGYSAICKRLGMSPDQVKPDAGKCKKIVRDRMGDIDQELYGDFICKLVGLAKGEGIGALVPDTEDRWYNLIQHHDMMLESEDANEPRAVELARKLLHASNIAAQDGIIDFNDQLYLVIKWNLRLFQNDFVFVDEAQDTNPVRRALTRLALKPGGRLIAVGDPKQGIFGFTGASHDALDLIQSEFNCIELPLTVCYRCASSIVAHAQSIVPYIEAAPNAPVGMVDTRDINDALTVLTAEDAILCRNTAPLVALAFGLIARGRGCRILGKDIGAGLIKLIKSMKAGPLDPTEPPNGRSLIERLDNYHNREVAKFTAKGEESKAQAVDDKVACILTVINNLPENARSVASVVYRIEKMFDDVEGVLTLATVHKVKGKEYRRVAILRQDLMPSKWARQEHQYQQELHLMYVAYTRAMEHLMFVTGELK